MIERKIPNNLEHNIVWPLLGNSTKSEENYLKKIEAFEIRIEKSLIETLSKVNVKSSVKADRFSLPFQKEIKISLKGESYMNGPYEIFRVARPIVKEILDKDIFKLRFYMFVEILEKETESLLDLGSVNYYFRYYIH